MKILNYETEEERGLGLILEKGLFIPFKELQSVLNQTLPVEIPDLTVNGYMKAVCKVFSDSTLYSKCIKLSRKMEDVHVLPPVSNPSKMIFLGLNYYDHAEEQGLTPPDEPVIFFKPKTTLTGPFDDIIWPRITKKLDYEGELVVVIGERGKYLDEDEAMNIVLGYTVCNDVSARDIQFRDKQWTRGKSYDTFAPMGPWIVTKEEIKEPHNLKIITKVNGEIRQNSNTSKMALKIPKIISLLSQGMTLEPGDLIATGTPAGVGFAFKPEPRFLNRGDVVEVYIENVGMIRNKVVKEG